MIVLVAAVGCGSTAKPTPSAPPPAAGTATPPTQLTLSSCTSTTGSRHRVSSSCLYVFSDGQRFRCSGSGSGRSASSTAALEHARGCVALTRIVISAAARAVIARIDTTRACLSKRDLPVSGGPVFPQQSPSSPDGELIVGSGASGAFIAFYSDAGRAARLEPQVTLNARRVGGQVERRGATTVLWIHHAGKRLRAGVLACALA